MWPGDVFHNQLGSRTMDKRGWQGWVGGSEGWWSSAQKGKTSWLEGDHGDCGSRGHPRPVSVGIPPQFVTLMLDFTTITAGVTEMSAPVQIIHHEVSLVRVYLRPWCNLLWITWHEMHGHVFCFRTQNYILGFVSVVDVWVLSRSVTAEEFLEDCHTGICKINQTWVNFWNKKDLRCQRMKIEVSQLKKWC